MNILPFVFAVLFVLSYGIGSSFQTQIAFYRNQKASLKSLKAEQNFLRYSEEKQFKNLPGLEVKVDKKAASTPSTRVTDPKDVPLPPINFDCARLNLFPLINEGKEAHLELYETAAKLLRIFYQTEVFGSKKRFEYQLLDQLLAAAKKAIEDKKVLPLETLPLKDSSLQPIYYTLLKGTKKHFPPLLEYFKVERDPSKICLFHAHPKMMTVFFGEKTAYKLYQELHKTKKASMELEAILQWGNQPQLAFVDGKVWELIDFHRPKHEASSPKIPLPEEGENDDAN
jgi:hypothetical protein